MRIKPNEVSKILKKSSSALIEYGARRYALELESLVVRKIDEMNLNVTGDMRKAVTHAIEKQVSRWIIQVGVNIKYAVFVHEGTRPHWPPFMPIKQWVVKKLNLSEYEANSVARAVQRKIAKVGTRPHPFMRIVFEQEKMRAAEKIAGYIKGMSW